jgi:threonine dehydrogenase-like Zn-dependent dehydrogenase
MGHEYVGVVEKIGADVKTMKVGNFVVGSFVISDNTCDICRSGYESRCVHGSFCLADHRHRLSGRAFPTRTAPSSSLPATRHPT